MANVIEGFEENVQTIQSYPILTIAQSQTPEISEGNIPNLKVGSLMNSISKQPLPERVELVAHKIWRSRVKLPARGEGSTIECFSPDECQGMAYGKCAQCQYADFNLKDACKRQIVFMVTPKDEPTNLMRLIFWKSNYSTGNRLLKSLQNECARRGAKSIFEVSFFVSTKRVKSEAAGAYYFVFQTEMGEKVEGEVLVQFKETFDMVTDLRKENIESFYASLVDHSAEAHEIPPAPPAEESGEIAEEAGADVLM